MLILNISLAAVYLVLPLALCIIDLTLKNLAFTSACYLLTSWTVATLIHCSSTTYFISLLFLLTCQLTLTGMTAYEHPLLLITYISFLLLGYMIKKNFTQQRLFPYFLALACYGLNPENHTLATISCQYRQHYGFTFFLIKLILNFYCLSLFLKYTSKAKPGNRL